MSEVISLNSKPDPMMWVCDCGCTTFQMFNDGSTECSACGGVSDDAGGWLPPDDDKKSDVSRDDTFVKTQGIGCADFAKAQIRRSVQSEDIRLAVVAFEDGILHVWSAADTMDEKGWADMQIASAKKILDERDYK